MLAGEPHFLTIDQIKRLDRWQVIGVHLAPRDENGAVIATGQPPAGEAAQPRPKKVRPAERTKQLRDVEAIGEQIIRELKQRKAARRG